MEKKERRDIEDLLMEELERCDWDLSEESLENIAKKLQNSFASFSEALEYVYSMTSSMMDDMK